MNYFVHFSRLPTALLCGLLLLAGCGETLESTVTGKVTAAGQPVPLAIINFHPVGRGPMPYAVTDDNGNYELLTASKTGLAPGTYRVAVEAASPEVPVAKKYGSVATSDLEFEVKSGQNVIDIELE